MRICGEILTKNSEWEFERCSKKAIWVVLIEKRGFPAFKTAKCGIHAKKYTKIEKLKEDS